MKNNQSKIFFLVSFFLLLLSLTSLNRITAGHSLNLYFSFAFSFLIIASLGLGLFAGYLCREDKISVKGKHITNILSVFIFGLIIFKFFPIIYFYPNLLPSVTLVGNSFLFVNIFIFYLFILLLLKIIDKLYTKDKINGASWLILGISAIFIVLNIYFASVCGINGCGEGGKIFSESLSQRDASICTRLKIPSKVRFLIPPFGIHAKENIITITNWYDGIDDQNNALQSRCVEDVIGMLGEEGINQCARLNGEDIFTCLSNFVRKSNKTSDQVCGRIHTDDYLGDRKEQSKPKSACYYFFASKNNDAGDCSLVDEEGFYNKNSCLVGLACGNKKPELCELLGKPSDRYGVNAQLSTQACKNWVQECIDPSFSYQSSYESLPVKLFRSYTK